MREVPLVCIKKNDTNEEGDSLIVHVEREMK